MAYIKCVICGDEFYHAKFTEHLLRDHGYYPQDYYEKFISKTEAPKCICGEPKAFKKLSDPYYRTCGNPECSSRLKSINLSNLNYTSEFQDRAKEAQKLHYDTDPEFREKKARVAAENLNTYVNSVKLSIDKLRLKELSKVNSLKEKYPEYLLYLVRLLDNYNDCIKVGVCRITDADLLRSRRLLDFTYYFDSVTLISLWKGKIEDIFKLESDVVIEFYSEHHQDVSFNSEETFKLTSESLILNYINERSSTIEKVFENIDLKTKVE